MSIIKKFLKSKPVQTIICRITWAYIWLVYLTTSWNLQIPVLTEAVIKSGKPFIFVFWHGRLLMIAPFRPKKRTLHVVISNHNDGQLIARVMEYFGFRMIRGSSNKKDGLGAFKEVIRALKNNEIVAITPDGPRGPRMRINGNVIKISQMQNIPIIPVTYSVKKSKILRSWDSFMLAKPFTKGIFIYGEPINPPTTNDAEAINNATIFLENKLNELTKSADTIMQITPIIPAPAK